MKIFQSYIVYKGRKIPKTFIQYKDENYRDERIFVQSFSQGTVQQGSNKYSKYILTMYRNTVMLPVYRTDDFNSKEETIKYIKDMEYKCPLISQDEKALPIPENEDKWEYWMKWLKSKNYHSAISGYQYKPYYWNPSGGAFGKDIKMTVIKMTEDDLKKYK